MIAIDTNLLIYAHRSGTREHRSARSAIETACGSAGGCAITLPSIAEFFSVVTHPAASGRPSSPGDAAAFLAALEEAGAIVLGPGPALSTRLVQTAAGGATELWTHDANFVKIPGLVIRDPLR